MTLAMFEPGVPFRRAPTRSPACTCSRKFQLAGTGSVREAGLNADAGPADRDLESRQVHESGRGHGHRRARQARRSRTADANPLDDIDNLRKIRAVILAGHLLRSSGARPASWRRSRRTAGHQHPARKPSARHEEEDVALAADVGCPISFGAIAEAGERAVADLLAGSPAADWRADPTPGYLDCPAGRVVISLRPTLARLDIIRERPEAGCAPFAKRTRDHRVQDNYVVPLDDADHHRPIPAGVRPSLELIADAHGRPRASRPLRLTATYMPRRSQFLGKLARRADPPLQRPAGAPAARRRWARAATIRRRATAPEILR